MRWVRVLKKRRRWAWQRLHAWTLSVVELWQRDRWLEGAKKRHAIARKASLQMRLLTLLAVGRDHHHPVAGSFGAVGDLALLAHPALLQAAAP
jgi:hypothetical protein